ncbi:Gfo/Idh/MocA family oxidoreductase [soil metagenome]
MQNIRVALVGAGFMGRMHSAVYGALDGVDLVHVIDKDPAAASKIAGEHGASISLNLDDLPPVHVVDICLPTDLHAKFSVQALNLGKHVVCEKPMALSLADADRMIAAAFENGRRLMIAHCIRFWPEYAELERLVKSEELGKLLSLSLTRYSEFPSWGSDNWLAYEERAGGAALDLHIHDTDYALYLMGVQPDSMTTKGNVDDHGVSHVTTTMTFGETVVHTEGSWNLPPGAPFKMAFRATFEQGAAIMDGGPLTVYTADGATVPEMPKMSAEETGGNISDLGGYYYELKYFYDALKNGTPLDRITPESARGTLATALAEIQAVKG